MVYHVRVCDTTIMMRHRGRMVIRGRGRMVIGHSVWLVVVCCMRVGGRVGWGRMMGLRMMGLRMMITEMRLSIMHWFVMVGRRYMVHWFVMVSSGGGRMMVGHTRCVVWWMIGHRMSIGRSLE